MSFRTQLCLSLIGLGAASTAFADGVSTKVSSDIIKQIPGLQQENIRESQIKGVYEISSGGSTGYISADGRFLIKGDMIELPSRNNITEQGRKEWRLRMIKDIKDADKIVFAPATKPVHTITVFTDVECGYCRKLHNEMSELNKLGISVQYLAYPRSGPNTEAWSTMESVWCSKDPKSAMTDAKSDKPVTKEKCGTHAIENEFRLGNDIGVRGTPTIVTDTGELIGGYVKAPELLVRLDAQRAALSRNSADAKSTANSASR